MNALSSANHDRQPAVPVVLFFAYTAFMAVLVPVYAYHYGWTNFLYFCDVSLFLTLYGMWSGRSLPISMAAVGILLPQALWCADFVWQAMASVQCKTPSGMTGYMFDANKPLYLRALSFFHGWLPFLLVYLLLRLGYDRRALKLWSAVMVLLCLVAYCLLPAAGAALADPNTPRNVNYVFGMDDAAPQTYLSAPVYLGCWMLFLVVAIYTPTHWLLTKCMRRVQS
jgi:hypothetical protein